MTIQTSHAAAGWTNLITDASGVVQAYVYALLDDAGYRVVFYVDGVRQDDDCPRVRTAGQAVAYACDWINEYL